ncbi:uncharacterized protein LOC132042777 [Lycium ferocissimum]|uniref:uncharacterized protein LOC132042777 n=1 Tax=Lycium ferocissimum TaxID=112874 RepID=UPI0028155F5B|nr:uncharacterized protein LOC132042777 [Lycium ferocissimum]
MTHAGVNSLGKIWYFIEDNVDVEVIYDTVQQVSLKLVFLDLNKTLVITLVYAKCDEGDRLQLWEDIYHVAGSFNFPWLVGGDFNVVLHEDDKIGGIPVQPQDYEDFAFCVNSCELLETGFKGSHFTWWNGRGGVDCIFERLDRVSFNQQFQQWFADIEIEHLARIGSDHAPLFITLKEGQVLIRPFRFLKFWTDHQDFLSVVSNNWASEVIGNPFILFKQKLKHLKGVLSAWSKEVYGDIFKQLMIREEIVRLKEALFESDPSPINRMALVTEEDNSSLVALPDIEEIKSAVFTMNGDSACGPDGFSGTFFQICWNIVGTDVFNIVKAFYEGFTLPKSITYTNLVLLSKKNDVETYADMRPISLSNFIIKVISRVVHGRLESVLPKLISANQSGFLKGRSIIENVLLTQEMITDIRKRGRPANVVIKLDMAKAYDRVSWLFLIRVLKRMCFADGFVDIIWRLIANNWYSVMLNGQPYGFFHSTRWVKKGDPLSLSPLSLSLFILAAEILSRALNSLFEDPMFRGYGMPKWSVDLNHLAYADDTIIFASADKYSLELIMGVLQRYEMQSGRT